LTTVLGGWGKLVFLIDEYLNQIWACLVDGVWRTGFG
jgi:hypothetical protein